MDYVLWTIAVLVGMYILVRLVFWAILRKEKAK